MRTIFSFEKLKGRDHSEDLGVKGKIILERNLGIVGWMHVAQYRSQWRTVRILRVPLKAENFLTR